MGYTTKFGGVLRFSQPLSGDQLRWIAELLADYDYEWLGKLADETAYPHKPETGDVDFRHYVDLRLTKDLTGLEWHTDTEKNSGMVTALKVIQHALLSKWPSERMRVYLEGTLTAQGESFDDVWGIEASAGSIRRVEMAKPAMTKCPHCRQWFETSKAQTNEKLNA